MTLHRRLLLTTSLAACGLAACTPADMTTVHHLAAEAGAIASGFTSAIAVSGPNLSEDLKTRMIGYLTAVEAAAQLIMHAATIGETQGPVGAIMAAVAGFASLVPALPVPPTVAATISQIVIAAQVLIPLMAASAGLAGATVPIVRPVMSEAQALAILTAARQ